VRIELARGLAPVAQATQMRERNELLAILAPMKRDIVQINVPPPRAQ